MRSVVLIAFAVLGLAACSSQSEQTGGGVYDMKAVQEYNARVTSGNTVTQAQKDKVASQVDTNLKLNASDNKVRTRVRSSLPVIPVVPSVGYHYNYHHFR
ncbi:hypothetical protein [Haemophilus haemolyticus]|uniref:Lipoprotein n=1 Tax=Haemophilus haemolyticus TaxID=726 RepID=A0A852PHL9_HAEHA|nr:hypothetical protein [Haemophilus haemolyticus]NYA27086.1 hypothetical protein [Haemophilus haemolyticus]